MFSTQADNCIPIVHIFAIISLFGAKLEEPKIGLSVKGLIFSFFDSINSLKNPEKIEETSMQI